MTRRDTIEMFVRLSAFFIVGLALIVLGGWVSFGWVFG